MPKTGTGRLAVWAAALVTGAGARAQTSLYTLQGGPGAGGGNGFGQAVAAAGDVDGDGFDDVIVGYRSGAAANAGTARVFSGADGGVLLTFDGPAPGAQLGRAVAGAGDVDGDGRADLVVGAAGDDGNGTDAGSAIVFSGAGGAVLYVFRGDAAQDRLGTSVAGLGDVNGDGFDDVAVGARGAAGSPNPGGYVRVHSGADGSELYTIAGPMPGIQLGCALAAAGDVDGDGVGDLVIGACRDNTAAAGAGSVRVHSGVDGALIRAFFGDVAQDQLGTAVASAGDVDGDGTPDVMGGSPFANSASAADVGVARVWSGADGTLLHSMHGDGLFDFYGAALSGLGDVDGDGRDDFAVGAFADDDGGSNAGRVVVYSGVDGSVLFTLDGDSLGDEYGTAVAGVGDLNGDGGPDFAFGAPVDNQGAGPGAGAVHVFAGVPPPPPPTQDPQSYCSTSPNSVGPGARMGWSGSTSIAANDLVLSVSGAPPRRLGLFFYGRNTLHMPFFSGYLCVRPPLGRLQPMVRVRKDGSAGRALDLAADLDPSSALLPGSTWYFQFVYDDLRTVRGRRWCRRPAVNLSDGLEVTFSP